MTRHLTIENNPYGFLRAKFDAAYRFRGDNWDWFAYDGPVLAHYTNLNGLVGIVESGGFWLSDFRFLNDTEEYFNGCRMAKEVIAKVAHRSRHTKFSSVLRETVGRLSEQPTKTFFVCSFSNSLDSLEQWRGYASGHDGIAIVFQNKPRLQLSHFTVMPVMVPQKVIYDDNVKRKQRDRARLGYIGFVQAGVDLPSVWDGLQGQIYLGSKAFIEHMQSNLSPDQSLDEIPRKQRRPQAKPLALYQSKFANDPRTGMALAYLTGDYAMKTIADAFDVHYTTVSRAVRAYESKHGKN